MITDKKLVNMYEKCRAHKLKLDKKRYAMRAIMFMPPALACVSIFVSYAMSLISGVVIMTGGGIQNGNGINFLCFIHALVMAVFAAGEVILENKQLISVSHIVYPAASITAMVFGCIIVFYNTISGLIFFAFSAYNLLMSIANIFFKRFYEENEMLRTLDGYPHFNIMLLSQNEENGKLIPKKSEEEIAQMTPDEKLMYERDRNM